MDTYSHVLDIVKSEAASRMDEIFLPDAPASVVAQAVAQVQPQNRPN